MLSGWFLPDLVFNWSPDKVLLSAAARKTDEVDGVRVVCWLEAVNQDDPSSSTLQSHDKLH